VSQPPGATALRDIGAIIRQTSELRRLCLSLREAKNRENEAALAVQFERAILKKDWVMLQYPEVVRAGFRSLWGKGQYDQIVTFASTLAADLIESNESTLMYYTCALRRQTATTAGREGAA
jgi:hypothetical protein